MSFIYESPPGLDLLADDFSAVVTEYGGRAPQTVIRDNQAWNINVRWQELGAGSGTVPGNWIVDAYVESIGPGAELRVGQATSPFGTLYTNHDVNIHVPTGTVPVAAGEKTTPYKLVITLTADWGDNPTPGQGTRYALAGYVEGPILQFFHTGP